MHSPYSASPVSESGSSRPSSITRSSRESFVAELETLPSESVDYTYELNEEVLDIEDLSDDDHDGSSFDLSASTSSVKPIENVNNKPSDNGEREFLSPVESELECKIRKGLEKVKKLDKILSETTEKEREVKRLRRAVEKEFQSQVAQLIEEKGADKVWGSEQLLYLCASSDRVEHMEDDTIEPIFPTQIDAEYYRDRIDSIPDVTLEPDKEEDISQNGEKTENKQKKGKDFVKRNIRLASHAQDLVLLTDEERKRLDELLADDTDLLMVENPFSSNVVTISGYQFSNEEHNALEKIDAQLKELIPSDDFTLAVDDSQLSDGDSQLNKGDADGSEIWSTSNEEFLLHEVKCGEQVLQKGYDDRRVVCRLRDIDVKLKHLKFNEEGLEAPIDPDLLRKLLDVDSRLTSDSISISESLLSKSASYNDIDTTTIGSECDLDMSNSQLCAVTN